MSISEIVSEMIGEYRTSPDILSSFDEQIKEAKRKTKHIFQGNPNCKNAEHCTVAIDVTTYGDLADNTKRYIKGTGECENE